jgi:hypothetical protein
MPAWQETPNPWGHQTDFVQYPGSKHGQYQDALEMEIPEPKILICYSAGAEGCLLFAAEDLSVEVVVLLGPTFTGADTADGDDIGFDGWAGYMDQILKNGTSILIIDDSQPLDPGSNELNAARYAHNVGDRLVGSVPAGTAMGYYYAPRQHYSEYTGPIGLLWGVNNDPRAVNQIYRLISRIR